MNRVPRCCRSIGELGHRQGDQYDGRAREDVDDPMVRRRNDGECHGGRHHDGKRSHEQRSRRAEENDANEQVPAEMEARHCRVLIREPRRLERTVRVRPAGDRVHQAGVDKPRWRGRKQREEEKADQARDDHGVAKQPIALAADGEQRDRDGCDQGPVAPDVHPVGEIDEGAFANDHRLETVLPSEPEVLLESCHVRAVSDRCRSAALRQFADAAVGKRDQSNHHQLPRNRPDCAPQLGVKMFHNVLPSLGSGDGTVIGADTHLVSEEVLIELVSCRPRSAGAATTTSYRVVPSVTWRSQARRPRFRRLEPDLTTRCALVAGRSRRPATQG